MVKSQMQTDPMLIREGVLGPIEPTQSKYGHCGHKESRRKWLRVRESGLSGFDRVRTKPWFMTVSGGGGWGNNDSLLIIADQLILEISEMLQLELSS